MSTSQPRRKVPSEVRIPLPDGLVLVVEFNTTIYIENYVPESRPAPAGCPVCAHNLSLMPDLQGRLN